MRHLRANLTSALRALRGNGLRTALTTAGVMIGVGSVVLLVAIGQGVKQDVTHQIDSLGENVVFVLPGKLDRSGQPNPMALMGISTLTERDVDALGRLPGVARCIPISFIAGSVERGGHSYAAMIVGTTDGIFHLRSRPLTEGRDFTAAELDQRVCVFSSEPKQDVFGAERAAGQSVLVRGVPFRVVGVKAPEESSLFSQGGFGNLVYLPLPAARHAFKAGQINRIVIVPDLKVDPEAVLQRIRSTLLADHGGIEDFGLFTQRQLLGALYQVFNIVEALLVGISAISLIVAGTGIMNIMLVTVTERTREIGIRKTVGARRADIFIQFLIEAVALSAAGGVAGALAAWGVCAAISAHTALHPIVSAGTLLLALGVCVSVGVVFGVAPAVRAARLEPIDALRWE